MIMQNGAGRQLAAHPGHASAALSAAVAANGYGPVAGQAALRVAAASWHRRGRRRFHVRDCSAAVVTRGVTRRARGDQTGTPTGKRITRPGW